jgi:nucleotide-binding universal stress UspA family protein
MKILIAVDFSQASSSIFSVARKYASLLSADCWLIHAADPEPYFIGYEPGPQSIRDAVAKRFRNEHKLLQNEADEMKKMGLNVTALLVQGPFAETILREAENLKVDLIIIGSHGHSAVHHLILGSVGQEILKNAKCPVLIVPTHKRT